MQNPDEAIFEYKFLGLCYLFSQSGVLFHGHDAIHLSCSSSLSSLKGCYLTSSQQTMVKHLGVLAVIIAMDHHCLGLISRDVILYVFLPWTEAIRTDMDRRHAFS